MLSRDVLEVDVSEPLEVSLEVLLTFEPNTEVLASSAFHSQIGWSLHSLILGLRIWGSII